MIEINRIYNEDCLEGMKRIPDKSVDMILCDLPYGTTWCRWDSIISFEKLWEQYNRIIKPNGAVVLFASQPFTTKLISSNIKNFKYTWYWVKNNKGNYLNAKRQPLRQVEEIHVFNKHKYYPQGIEPHNKVEKRKSAAKITLQNYIGEWFQENTGYPSNILHFNLDKEKLHPTQKPVALFEYLIKTYTNDGETVLDNCMGSGTTAIACMRTSRNFIGFELDKEYFDIANKRISEVVK
jgi:site-specific DNA-methyltransferase (adenine-specific)